MARNGELKSETMAEIDLASRDGSLLVPPTSLKSYEDYLANLRAVLKHSEGTDLKTKLAHKLIHKIEVFPDWVKIYFKVGRATIDQGVREIQFLQPSGTKKADAGALAAAPLALKYLGSNRLTNGGVVPLRVISKSCRANLASLAELLLRALRIDPCFVVADGFELPSSDECLHVSLQGSAWDFAQNRDDITDREFFLLLAQV